MSLEPGIWPFWGALGGISSVGDRESVLAVTRRHWRVFGNVVAHGNRVRVAQLSYSEKIGGSGHLEKLQAPTDKKKDLKKIEKNLDFYFCCGFKKCGFVQNRAIFFVFGPRCPL